MEKYIPDIYQKSIYTVNYNKLFKHGIKCILFDIDNTLVPTGSKEIEDELYELIDKIKKIGITPIIYTSSNSKRVKLFTDSLNIDGYVNVHKMFPKSEILKKYREPEIAIIGDEMFTDIKFGNELGITTILVNQISKKDGFITRIKRIKEKRIVSKLRKNNLFVKGRYYE